MLTPVKKISYVLTALLATLVSLGVQAGYGTIFDIVKGSGRFDELEKALRRTGLDLVLDGQDEFTVFAPTDNAFHMLYRALGVDGLSDIDDETLRQVLLYHVVEGVVFSSDLSDGQVETVQGQSVTVDVRQQKGVIFINDARVIDADIKAKNGVVHVINRVLVPDLEPAEPEKPDYPEEPVHPDEPEEPDSPNLVDLLEDDNRFDILYGCIKTAGLLPDIRGGDDLTIFGPTDGAFRDFFHMQGIHGCGDLPKSDLQEVLLYHVLGELVAAEDLSDDDRYTTLNGAKVKINFRNNGRIFVNDARIIDPDNFASNGVVHAIRKVLLPPSHYN